MVQERCGYEKFWSRTKDRVVRVKHDKLSTQQGARLGPSFRFETLSGLPDVRQPFFVSYGQQAFAKTFAFRFEMVDNAARGSCGHEEPLNPIPTCYHCANSY